MNSREDNLGIRVGDSIIHCNRIFTIVNIGCEEQVEGMVLSLRAFDPDMATREQEKAIKVEQTQNQVVDMLKKITGEGGALGNAGFNIGG